MAKITEPDYRHSILNTISSILAYYDVRPDHSSLDELDSVLKRKHFRNILFMVFDGMGIDALLRHLSHDSLLRNATVTSLTSVYPSTTTAAMTSYYSGLSPAEHGWIGWSLYFKEYGRTIDTFLGRDSYTCESAGEKDAARTLMPYETIYQKIANQQKDALNICTINPEGIVVAGEEAINLTAGSLEDLTTLSVKAVSNESSNFVMTYWPEPDLSMHKFGCGSEETHDIMQQIEKCVETIQTTVSDTLVIVSADHGLTDVETIYLDDYNQIMERLVMPPFIEPRCASFFVKPGFEASFMHQFNALFSEDFKLIEKQAFLDAGLLGEGLPHYKTDDFLGDFIAVATGNKILKYRTLNLQKEHIFAAHHAGLRTEEMMVPLIVIET